MIDTQLLHLSRLMNTASQMMHVISTGHQAQAVKMLIAIDSTFDLTQQPGRR